MNTEFVDLVLDNGELVRIEYPEEFVDELYDSLQNATKTRDYWSPVRVNGCTATYMGHMIDRVNMGRVVAMM